MTKKEDKIEKYQEVTDIFQWINSEIEFDKIEKINKEMQKQINTAIKELEDN